MNTLPVPRGLPDRRLLPLPVHQRNGCHLIDNRFVACTDGVRKTQEEASPQCTLTMPCAAGKTCVSNHCQ